MSDDLPCKPDEEIALLVQAGRDDFFAILIARYEAKLKRYSQKFLADQDKIDDVVQDVFVKAYSNLKSFDTKRKFSSWIYRIAHNELVNILKKKNVLPLFDLDNFLPHHLRVDTLQEEVEKKELAGIIDKCLQKIEAKYREPLILYYLEGLSYQEVADVMQIPTSTVGVRIQRAKKLLRPFCQKAGC